MEIFIKLISNGILIQILMLFFTAILSRIYSVDNFGELAFYVSFGSIMSVIGGMRFDYILLQERILDKTGMYFLSNISSLFVNFIALVVLFLIQNFSSILNEYSLSFLFLFGLGFSLFNNLIQFFISKKRYDYFLKLRFIQVILVFIISIFGFYTFDEIKVNGLLYAYSGSQLILGLIGYILVFKDRWFEFNLVAICDLYRENFSDAIKNSLISFIQYSTPLVPIIIGGILYDKKIIGAYFIYAQMISAPLNIIRRNLLVYLNGEFSSVKNFYYVFSKLFSLSLSRVLSFLIILVLLFLTIYFFRAELVTLLLGKQWLSYVYLLLPLMCYFVLDSLLQPFTTLLPLWNKINIAILNEGARFLLVVILLPIISYILKFNFFTFLSIYILFMLSIYLFTFYKIYSISRARSKDF